MILVLLIPQTHVNFCLYKDDNCPNMKLNFCFQQ